MTPDLSYDQEGERIERAKIINGMGKIYTPSIYICMMDVNINN